MTQREIEREEERERGKEREKEREREGDRKKYLEIIIRKQKLDSVKMNT